MIAFEADGGPSTMLRMVPLPRRQGMIEVEAGHSAISSHAKRGSGTAEGGGGGGAPTAHPGKTVPPHAS